MHIDTKEFEIPDTLYIRDIDSAVFQSIVLQCLAEVKGVSLLDGGLLDTLLGRDGKESVRGIFVQQDPEKHSVSVKVEIGVLYGINLPQKAEEIQSTIAHEITKLTGLHVAAVHVVFKNIFLKEAAPTKEKEPEGRYTARFS